MYIVSISVYVCSLLSSHVCRRCCHISLAFWFIRTSGSGIFLTCFYPTGIYKICSAPKLTKKKPLSSSPISTFPDYAISALQSLCGPALAAAFLTIRSHSIIQEISLLLVNLTVHYRDHNSPPLDPIKRLISPVSTLTLNLCKSTFLFSQLHVRFSTGS
jgi:hypothetical protein